ncbi:cysteine hydrolase family protein [Gordonibacter massiliensis (ex Traore et al. 2017)]|uniref:Cysteine hydrolase n=1 Tax=Gordonibacter massiliensis (ex Traore et al. 2017) TaxID=1841863 RepID=A0A842JLH7_9ACTN|nr:isochorismatase family cysteine hydrolase [Gordonibacter massiliensis (ex Traore et al. 2017)]MBC2890608.1 cysteine hydrolase [Gordonibacter massiliensis (ex Traore et al. 2017)]
MLGDELNKNAFELADLDKERCALLVIDVLGDPTALPSPLREAMLPVVENAARLCDAARGAGVPVVFTNDAHIPGLDRELDLWGEHGLAGTPQAQPAPQLKCGEGDYVVDKRRYSGFFQTGLRLLLDELGVDTLLCIGMDTNICVRHTVADAYFNNFRIVVAGDATLTFLVGDQDEGLAYMETCYAAKVVPTREAVAFLEG